MTFTPEEVEQIRAIAREERIAFIQESNLRFLQGETDRAFDRAVLSSIKRNSRL